MRRRAKRTRARAPANVRRRACAPLPAWRRPSPPSPLPAVLVGLYEEPERPPNAVEYVKKVMGAPVGVDVDALKAENERLKAENKALKESLEAIAAGKGAA